MFPTLPTTTAEFAAWDWPRIAPLFEALAAQALTSANVDGWLADWSRLAALVRERHERLWVATTLDTSDAEAEARYSAYLQTIMEPYELAAQGLKAKLLASGLTPTDFGVPLRKMRADAALFADANLPLLTREKALVHDYDRVIGAQTVMWDGIETTLEQLRPALFDPDRAVRERAWRATSKRQLQDRAAINALWGQMLALRGQLAAAGLPRLPLAGAGPLRLHAGRLRPLARRHRAGGGAGRQPAVRTPPARTRRGDAAPVGYRRRPVWPAAAKAVYRHERVNRRDTADF